MGYRITPKNLSRAADAPTVRLMRLCRLFPLFVCFVSFVIFPFCSSASASAADSDVEFVRVWPGWRDAESFERISEYFTGQERTGDRVVLRTQPAARAGFYYLVRVANRGQSHPGAKFALHVITPAVPDSKTYTFSADLPERSTLFHLGLTGADWAGPDVHPVAWKLDLLSADDRVLATTQSFLWSKPAK